MSPWFRRRREAEDLNIVSFTAQEGWTSDLPDPDGEIAELNRRHAAAQQAAMVKGKHYTELVPTLDRLRTEKRDDEALKLLVQIIPATERESAITGMPTPYGYTERAAIIYRRKGDTDAEIGVLERWLAANPEAEADHPIWVRLTKARARR